MRLIIYLFIAMCSITTSNAAILAGYDQFCGIPVLVEKTPQTAVASRDREGKPIIYIDPSAMSNWTHSRIFTLAHECGHHRLGHSTPSGMLFRKNTRWATKTQELQADCWAAIALRQIWELKDINRMINIYRNEGGVNVGGYPSGLERAENIRNCAYGSYQVDNGAISSPVSSTKINTAEQTQTPFSYRHPAWAVDSNTNADSKKLEITSPRSRFGRYLEIIKTEIPNIFSINDTTRKYHENGICRASFEFTFTDKKTMKASLDFREDILFKAGEINNKWVWVEVDKWIPGTAYTETPAVAINPNSKLTSLNAGGFLDDLISFGMAHFETQSQADKARDIMAELVNICHGPSM